MVPGHTPEAVILRLNQEIGGIIKMADIQSRLEGLGADATSSTPEQFAALIRTDIERWSAIIPALGLQVQ